MKTSRATLKFPKSMTKTEIYDWFWSHYGPDIKIIPQEHSDEFWVFAIEGKGVSGKYKESSNKQIATQYASIIRKRNESK